jgi:hypothetical protein
MGWLISHGISLVIKKDTLCLIVLFRFIHTYDRLFVCVISISSMQYYSKNVSILQCNALDDGYCDLSN